MATKGELILGAAEGAVAGATSFIIGTLVDKTARKELGVDESLKSIVPDEVKFAKFEKAYIRTASVGAGAAVGFATLVGLDNMTDLAIRIGKSILKA